MELERKKRMETFGKDLSQELITTRGEMRRKPTSAYDNYLQELKHQKAKCTMPLRRLTVCRTRISSQARSDMVDYQG